jgi:hypothetical protein
VRRVVPPPAGARSLEVTEDGVPVFVAPGGSAERRGTIAQGTRLPLHARLADAGCPTGIGYRVGEQAYICAEHVRPSRAAPGGRSVAEVEPGELLPQRYAFVRFDATRAYAHPNDYFTDQYVSALGEGFGLVVTGRTVFDGMPFLRTRRGLWVSQEALRPVRPSDFAGVELDHASPGLWGWARASGAPVHVRPHGPIKNRLSRRERVRIVDEAGPWLKLQDGGFIRDRHLQRMRPVPPPEGVQPGQRWVDVDVAEQVLTAYEGARPVFATLVSTGRRQPSRATPEGVFRIWVKLAYSDMDDLERTDVERNYAIERVPWVQYFEEGNGFHAAFWHDDFGRRRSHGCVNLSPADARWLFDFTEPHLPVGWEAIVPTEEEPGSLVRVR